MAFDPAFFALMGLRTDGFDGALDFTALLTVAAFFERALAALAFFFSEAFGPGGLVGAFAPDFVAVFTPFDAARAFFDAGGVAVFLAVVFFAVADLPVTALADFVVALPATGFAAAAFFGALLDVFAAAGRLTGAFFAAGLVGRFNVLVLLTTTSGGSCLHTMVSPQRRFAPACTRQRSQVKGFDAGS